MCVRHFAGGLLSDRIAAFCYHLLHARSNMKNAKGVPPAGGAGQNSASTKPLDIEDSPLESVWAFLRRQPTKYWRSFVAWAVSSFVVALGLGYGLGTLISGLQRENEVTRLQSEANRQSSVLKVENADLSSRLRAAEQITAALKEELGRKIAENERNQGTIEAMRGDVAGYERRLQAARGCQQTKKEFDAFAEKARVLSIERSRLDRVRDSARLKEIEAEGSILEGKFLVYKGMLDACSGK